MHASHRRRLDCRKRSKILGIFPIFSCSDNTISKNFHSNNKNIIHMVQEYQLCGLSLREKNKGNHFQQFL